MKLEEAKHTGEAARALAETDKAKCCATMEAAAALQKLADLEAQRCRNAELAVHAEEEEVLVTTPTKCSRMDLNRGAKVLEELQQMEMRLTGVIEGQCGLLKRNIDGRCIALGKHLEQWYDTTTTNRSSMHGLSSTRNLSTVPPLSCSTVLTTASARSSTPTRHGVPLLRQQPRQS
jgi:hypothetical protein